MAQPAASSDRQVLGRRSRDEWRLRLLILVLRSLLMVPVAIVTIVTRDPAAALGFFVFALIWFSVFGRAVGTGRMVTFDSSDVEVQTLLRTWHYRWSEIAAVRWDLLPTRWSLPGMTVVQTLKFVKSVDDRSGLAKRLKRLTGGDGVLPDLDPDEIETLREALARYGSAVRDQEPTTGGVWVMRALISHCEGLGDISDVTRIGSLASIDLVDYETTGAKVRESLMSGRWAAASAVQQGTAGSDWVHWYVIERTNGQGAVLEVVSYFELWANDECDLVRTLTRYDLDTVRPYVIEWTSLPPEDNARISAAG
jgi:hypothetical protein